LAEAVYRRSSVAKAEWPARVLQEISRRRNWVADAATKASPGVLHPFTASEILSRHIERESVLVLDGALTYLWFSELASFVRPRGFLCHGYLGSMGVGMGTAAGSQVAMLRSGLRTFLVTGDGAVGFGLAEFDTLVRHKLPVIVVVMNNHSWGATQHFQKYAVGTDRITNTMLGDARYDKVAEALGAKGFYVDDEASFEAALSAALAHDGPCCIEVQVSLDPLPPEELQLIGIDPFATPREKIPLVPADTRGAISEVGIQYDAVRPRDIGCSGGGEASTRRDVDIGLVTVVGQVSAVGGYRVAVCA
jgi:acetolactate synthase-1/2/3 large subunit